MSSSKEPGYFRRRKEREQKKQECDRAERDAQESNARAQFFNSMMEEVRSYRTHKEKSEPETTAINKIAAIASVIAAALSAGSLCAFLYISMKTDSTANTAISVSRNQLDEMQFEQRPWIKPTVSFSGLRFDEKNNARIDFSLNYKNVGKTPARDIHTNISAKVVEKKDIFSSTAKEMETCNIAERSIGKTPGVFIFPDEDAPQILEGHGEWETTVDSSTFSLAWPNEKTLTFRLIGCIVYTYGSKTGSTSFSYDISRNVNDGTGHTGGFLPRPGEIAGKDINFVPYPFSSGYVR